MSNIRKIASDPNLEPLSIELLFSSADDGQLDLSFSSLQSLQGTSSSPIPIS